LDESRGLKCGNHATFQVKKESSARHWQLW
jgi:hypothetical protein